MSKAILLGGPRDGTLLSFTSSPPEILTMSEFELRELYNRPPDDKLLNTPIPLVQYERISISFGRTVQTGMIFYFYKGKA